MKILVLNNDLMERTVIQQVLNRNVHEIVTAENSQGALQQIQDGKVRFVIADRATTDMDQTQFIQRVRAAKLPGYTYILLVTPRVQDTDLMSRAGADDYVYKPIAPAELKSRVAIGERILSLGDNLVNAKGSLDEDVAMFDPLTNMLNQKAFLTLARGELERARREQSPLSLIALDIDSFKKINDKHGREVGNDVLTMIAQAIRDKNRPYDSPGRYEDDLFLIPLPGVIGQDAEKIANRIVKGVLNTNVSLLDGAALNLTVSAGIVSSIRITTNMEIEGLIEKAKEAVARAKLAGGNQVYTIFI